MNAIDQLAVEMVSTADLIPYARNARTHSEAQVAQIAASIEQFGFVNPVLINADNGIIAGHGRALAAEQIGMASVPCVRLKHLTEAQERALILADNKLALNAGWDESLLAAELAALQEMDFVIPVIGFDESELSALFATKTGQSDPDDDVPEPPSDPVSRPGDIWILGDHRIICGDSTNADDVAKLLNGKKPHLMVTDPPYGVEYAAGWRNEAMPQKNDPARWKDGTGSPTGAVSNDDNADWSAAWALFSGDVAYVWHAGNKAHIVAESLLSCGFEVRAQIIWNKHQLVIGRGDYHPKHEPCWYCVRKGKNGRYVGGRKQTTVWDIDKPQKSETGHSTQKPVECMQRPIENNSKPGDYVYEPFSGSGTTIIAGEITGRRVLAVELNPGYIDVAVNRWQEYTGKEAVHAESGKTFGVEQEARSIDLVDGAAAG